jgi:DNA-binding transcriptional LysR family regulator
MLDFRLKVFYTVAQTLNFNKTAEKLFITQPAVSKHIKELEQQYGVSLFNRTNKRITLTKEGEILKSHAQAIFEEYQKVDFELNLLKNKASGTLKIGASTTISQYIIPTILAKFHRSFPDIKVSLLNANSSEIEHLLADKKIELGIVEGINKNSDIKYLPFMTDEIVLVCNAKNQFIKKDTLGLKDLTNLPLLTREDGSGTFDIITNALKKEGIKISQLNIEMQLGSTEAIKNYLLHSNTYSLLSTHSIKQELANHTLKIISVKNLKISRMLSFAHKQGQPAPLADFFVRFALSN